MAINDEFISKVSAWCGKSEQDLQVIVRVAVFKMLGQIVNMSPVGNPELWAVNRRQTQRRKRQAQATAAAYRSDAYSYQMKNGTRKLRKGLRKRLALSEAKYNNNHGPVRNLRKTRRAGGEIYRPKGYRGGRFRANWQVGVGPRPTGWKNDIIGPAEVIAKGEAILQGFDGTQQTIWITNCVPYAVRLEYGHSKQAPQGMVRLTAQRFSSFVSSASREVRGK